MCDVAAIRWRMSKHRTNDPSRDRQDFDPHQRRTWWKAAHHRRD